uniref:Cnidarian restricted protein n=1 Tax=Clytia hemisphaerica TaxID=252671 RepID=A0A7M6DLC6_9CNID|eukprot:TCONS_00058343-protein
MNTAVIALVLLCGIAISSIQTAPTHKKRAPANNSAVISALTKRKGELITRLKEVQTHLTRLESASKSKSESESKSQNSNSFGSTNSLCDFLPSYNNPNDCISFFWEILTNNGFALNPYYNF